MLTRFAPAPTGWLHLGHVLNAEHVWGGDALASPTLAERAGGPAPPKLEERAGGPAPPKLEERAGGPAPPKLEERRRVLLRIEDHDRERCRRAYEAGILDDLDWLGYRPDIFPTAAFRAGRCDGRQSDRDAIYREAVDLLAAKGLVYACDCSRSAILADQTGGPELRYAGRCRDRGLPLADGCGWRVRMDPGVERFVDRALGPQAQDPSTQCGDLLIRDRIGNWTYQLAATVDDVRQGIELVVRGVDLLPSTGRQIRLARLLGRDTPPAFLHHALIMKEPGQKLSKSDGDTGIRDLRARGWTPEQVKAAARNAALQNR